MKNVFLATAAIFGFATAASAQSLLPVPVMGSIEYAVEAEAVSIDLGTEVVFGNVAITPFLTMSDASGEFDLDSIEVTGTYMLGSNVDLYATIEGDKEFEYAETTVGIAFRF